MIFSGCAENKQEEKKVEKISENVGKNIETENDSRSLCREEKVNLPNYGEPGKRLANCFVEYPGEPTRQDKSYYIVEDICGQFSKEFVENALGRKIEKVEPSEINTANNCTFYLDGKENIIINLEYLPAENQKKGHEAMGRKAEKNLEIPMDNFVITEENGAVNTAYLILNPNKFISIRSSSAVALDIVQFVANIGKEINNYK